MWMERVGYQQKTFRRLCVRYKKVRKDWIWINGGGTAGDWPFGGPVLDEKEAGNLMASFVPVLTVLASYKQPFMHLMGPRYVPFIGGLIGPKGFTVHQCHPIFHLRVFGHEQGQDIRAYCHHHTGSQVAG